jgi:hypothetical protein
MAIHLIQELFEKDAAVQYIFERGVSRLIQEPEVDHGRWLLSRQDSKQYDRPE